ncbi:hypothetical protein K439DRAFT_1657594 [Ramaria rubella]|nr:hypothetical protein K439DRAFT_1657594 [Ramaria rubella]
MSSLKIPTFDGTLGALFIGFNLTTALYGVTCVQMFIYVTSERGTKDRRSFRLFVYTLFAQLSNSLLDTGQQIMTSMGMYRYLITNYLNITSLVEQGPGSPRWILNEEGIFGLIIVVLVQLYFAWRVWAFFNSSRSPWKWMFTVLTGALALFSFGSSLTVIILGFTQSVVSAVPGQNSTSSWILSWKLSMSSTIACDSIITGAMVASLYKSRTGLPETNNTVNILILFNVNTLVITTLFSIATLVTFLVLPNDLVYVALQFVGPKSYINSALATINSRDYIGGKLTDQLPTTATISTFQFTSVPTGSAVPDNYSSEISSSSVLKESTSINTEHSAHR